MNLDDPTLEAEISQRIYFIRGLKVMLDSDLAELYEVPVKRLNEQVRRNLERFPSDFMVQIVENEWEFLRSQFATLRSTSWGEHRKYLPLAFTEQGVAMLSGVLHSPRAIHVNLEIMRTFVKLRSSLENHRGFSLKIEQLEQKSDKRFKIVFNALRKMMADPPLKRIVGLNKRDA
jgi:hypothetical protein